MGIAAAPEAFVIVSASCRNAPISAPAPAPAPAEFTVQSLSEPEPEPFLRTHSSSLSASSTEVRAARGTSSIRRKSKHDALTYVAYGSLALKGGLGVSKDMSSIIVLAHAGASVGFLKEHAGEIGMIMDIDFYFPLLAQWKTVRREIIRNINQQF